MATCVRTAWLDYDGTGSYTMPLENTAAGYVCQNLDLGYPAVRAVISNKPAAPGADDRTTLAGPRAVSADITALVGAGCPSIDATAAQFGPFMDPSLRPVLHYVLDRPGAPERVLTVRAADYTWQIKGPYQRDIHLAWVAADPIARNPTQTAVSAFSGSSGGVGRVYPLTFPRTYPAGSASATNAIIQSPGDVAVRPLLRIYGPITQPRVTFQAQPGGAYTYFGFVAGFNLGAGQWVDVDSIARTVYRQSDPTQNAMGSVDWSFSTWPYIAPQPASAIMGLSGSSTGTATQVQAMWHDGYVT